MLGGLFGRSLRCWVGLCPRRCGRLGLEQVGGVEPERVIPSCFGMFGCISGPVTTTQYRAERAERAEHRCRERASSSHRPRVFVQDRMGAWVIDRIRAGWTPRMIAGRSRIEFRENPRMWVSCDTIYQWIYHPGPAPPPVMAVPTPHAPITPSAGPRSVRSSCTYPARADNTGSDSVSRIDAVYLPRKHR